MFTQFITVFLILVGIASIHSLPVNNKTRKALSTTDPSSAITIPESVLDILTDVNAGDRSKGLFQLQRDAKSLLDDELFNSEVV